MFNKLHCSRGRFILNLNLYIALQYWRQFAVRLHIKVQVNCTALVERAAKYYHQRILFFLSNVICFSLYIRLARNLKTRMGLKGSENMDRLKSYHDYSSRSPSFYYTNKSCLRVKTRSKDMVPVTNHPDTGTAALTAPMYTLAVADDDSVEEVVEPVKRSSKVA